MIAHNHFDLDQQQLQFPKCYHSSTYLLFLSRTSTEYSTFTIHLNLIVQLCLKLTSKKQISFYINIVCGKYF